MNKDQANGLEVVATLIAERIETHHIDEDSYDFNVQQGAADLSYGEHDLVTLSNAQAYAEQVRAETIDECAKVCDSRKHREYKSRFNAVSACVAAIRALGEKK